MDTSVFKKMGLKDGITPVSQVAIDEKWSDMRFKRISQLRWIMPE